MRGYAICLAVLLLGNFALVSQGQWFVGSSTSIVTPKVNGTVDYVRPVDEFDADSPGTLVLKFDQGQIPIGNGNPECNWVRDHVKTAVMAIRGSNNITVVYTTADLYMVFEPDWKVYRDRLKRKLGNEEFSQLRFVSSGTHNHHGPDTSGLSLALNRDWYDSLLDIMVSTTITALRNMKPANLVVSDSIWKFGQGDLRDPLVVDPVLNVLQARSIETGAVLTTLVQWTFHPEVTLGYSPKVPDSDCIALGKEVGCSANGRYMSADFPGHLRNYLNDLFKGGDVLYINGALGNQIGAHGTVWEVSEKYPITGDGSVVPEGAPIVSKSFRKTLLIGRELAYAVARSINGPRAKEIPYGSIQFETETTYTRIGNILFLAGMAPKYLRPNQPLVLGYALRDLFVCPNDVPPTDENCVFDNYDTYKLGDFSLPIRKGNHAKAQVIIVRLGPITMFTIPGELAPELSNGLPADFDDPNSVSKYYKNPQQHVVGKDYVLPGVLKDMIKCDYCWTLGLTTDSAGYIFPISDWRIGCIGRNCDGKTYITGESCKKIIDSGDEEGRLNCLFGQVYQVDDHYEETIATSWDIAQDIIDIYSKMLGVPPSGRYTKDKWNN